MGAAKTFTIPTVFAAVDRITAPVRNMMNSMGAFGRSMELAAARGERLMNRLPSVFSEADKEMFGFAKSAAVAAAAVGGLNFTVGNVLDYQDELANLKALTGATAMEFAGFKTQITEVAVATRKSTVDVAKAFTAIANNQPALLKSAEGLAAVTKASILLAQAGRMELEPAGMAVTDILNQWGQGAANAAKLVDMLAAGSVAGSSEIRDTQEALKIFGTVAANLNISTLESIAALELVSPFKKGAEAGTGFVRILSEMAKGNAQDPLALRDWARLGVNIKTVTDKSLPFATRLQEIAKISKDNTAIIHTFGVEHAALATALLNSANKLPDYIEKVNSVGEAQRMAAENTSTLRDRLKQMTDRFTTLITTSNTSVFAIGAASRIVGLLTDNMNLLLNIAIPAVSVFVAMKGAILGMQAAAWLATKATAALNFVEGIATVITGQYATSCFATAAGMRGMATASFFLEAGLWGSLGVIGLAIGAVAALHHEFTKGYDASIDYVSQLKKTKDGLYEIAKPFTDAQVAAQLFNKEMEKFRELQNYEGYLNYTNQKGSMWDRFMLNLEPILSPVKYQRYANATSPLDASGIPRPLMAPRPEDFGIDSAGKALPALNPRRALNENSSNTSNTQTNQVEITIKDKSGQASVTNNPGGVPISYKNTKNGQ